MKKHLLSVILAFLFVLAGFAPVGFVYGQTIQGVVSDESSKPLSFVSIYLKSNPYLGTSSNMDGTYSLDLGTEKVNKDDVVIFSFIGYKTVEQRVKDWTPDKQLVIKLIEQPIMLEGAAVTAKVSRKSGKAAKLLFMEKFKKQLEKDFPKVNRNYSVVSGINVTKDSKVLMSNEIIGNIYEYPQAGRGGTDSLRITKESIKDFTDGSLVEGLKQYVEKAKADSAAAVDLSRKKAKEVRARSNLGSSIGGLMKDSEMEKRSKQLHRILWQSNITALLKEMDSNLKNWEITYTNDHSILTYREKKGLLGIAKYERVVHFILDSDTYSVERLSENLVAELNIPFGYKLRPEQLDLLNIVNIGENQIEKYRLRHINVDMKRNVIYRDSADGKVADEKNMNAGFSIEDSKERTIQYNAKALAKVISVKKID